MWRSIKDDNTLFCVVCCKCARVSCTRDVTEISWQSAQESNSLHRMNSFQYVVVVISLCYASYTGIIEDLSTVAVACERVIDDDCISYTVVSCLVSVHHHWRRLSHSVLTSQCTDQPSLTVYWPASVLTSRHLVAWDISARRIWSSWYSWSCNDFSISEVKTDKSLVWMSCLVD